MAASEAEAYLIEAVRRGDQRAWGEVIDRYQGRLMSFARRMLAHPGDAEDLVQETFLGLLRSLPSYDPSRSLETYLFAILRNKLHDHFRRLERGQRQSLDQLEIGQAPQAWVDLDTPSRHVSQQEELVAQRSALVDCLRQWVEKCRQGRRFRELMVVEMLVVLGLRNKEVAEDLGLSEIAVAGIKFRVLEQWTQMTRAALVAHDWHEADLAADSTVARIWRDEGLSCLKRSTLGRYLLGALDEDWNFYVDFHVSQAACPRCQANLDDLRQEDQRDTPRREQLRQRFLASSVGFLSRRPPQSPADPSA